MSTNFVLQLRNVRFSRNYLRFSSSYSFSNLKIFGKVTLGIGTFTFLQKDKVLCDGLLIDQKSLRPSIMEGLPNVTPSKVETISVAKTWLQSLWDNLVWFFTLAQRTVTLSVIYSPALLSLPLLLLRFDATYDLWWNTFRFCISQAGACHIKFAQWIATRPDLFPDYVCQCFGDLQSSKSSHIMSLNQVQKILTSEFGDHWSDFIRLEIKHVGKQENPTVLGGGCVAQVYKAEALVQPFPLSPRDKAEAIWIPVALKVTHPHIRERILADLELMRTGASFLEYLLPDLKHISLVDSVEEFVPMMMNQVNMKQEAINLLQFRQHFHNENLYCYPNQINDFLEEYQKSQQQTYQTLLYRGLIKAPTVTDNTSESSSTVDSTDLIVKMSWKGWILQKLSSFIHHPTIQKMIDRQLVQTSEEEKNLYHVYFPEPLLLYTTERILMETAEEGILMRDYLDGDCNEEEKKLIGQYGLNAILKMVFLDNFVHADLHPGNILMIRPSSPSSSSQSPDSISLSAPNFLLCFIDCGIIGSLQPQDQENLITLFDAVIKNEGYLVGQYMIDRSRYPESISLQQRELFAKDMEKLVSDVHQKGLRSSKIDINQLLSNVLRLCYQYQVKLESRYAIIMLAMGIVEGLGRKVDPEIDLMSKAAPFVLKASIEHITNTNTTTKMTTF